MNGRRLEWRLIDPCTATKDGYLCEGEAGHDGEHWYTVWEWDEVTQEMEPSYPVTWTAEVTA